MVHVNYRQGPFSIWYDKPRKTENPTSNFGLQDQLMAMRFIKENIELFGGDPERITISGCSTGATTVSHHVTNPASHEFFTRSIMFSAPLGIPFYTADEAHIKAATIAANVTCCNDSR